MDQIITKLNSFSNSKKITYLSIIAIITFSILTVITVFAFGQIYYAFHNLTQ